MFGFKTIKQSETLDIKRGDVFRVDNKQLYKEDNAGRSLFANKNLTWLNDNPVIVVGNNMKNKFNVWVHVLPITKALNSSGKYDIVSIDDILTIKKTHLEENVGLVSESTMEMIDDYFGSGNHKAIPVKYQ